MCELIYSMRRFGNKSFHDISQTVSLTPEQCYGIYHDMVESRIFEGMAELDRCHEEFLKEMGAV